jgi:hypothetical protein
MIGKTIEEIKVGDSAKFSKTISESDVYLFGPMSMRTMPKTRILKHELPMVC